ncbi:unnamed protein product (macronuclear) [Paramecium tetraurelia]|uniref:uridine/cytidine kinase n=1 Tax=Paramecium tetraurelia TaxID=5888 RepID=A0BPX9_PARTE|nr:uncharacterized protein GSPATT00005347001 [Paramecium tetraurelia]CAK60596.1 unnamed protein product [Paramecium tetraurelia]|eukprot:XP_001427994.1 hypothetical protein (macronuclear) [Paramecium tetraurelia strain d4-2]
MKSSEYEPQRILVGVTGGSAAGKTTLCETIKREIQYDSDVDMTILSCDSFYKGVDKSFYDISQYNFDHPDSLDFDNAFEVISTLLSGRPASVPIYCFVNHKRLDQCSIMLPAQVIVFEGIMALYDERIRDLMSYKIFIHCDDDIRLCRRILRDVKERQRTVESVLFQYTKFVKRAFENFIEPLMSQADLIIPGHRSNHVSVAFIVNHLKNMAKQNGLLREKLNTLIYFGDLLYSIDGFMRNRTKVDFSNPNATFKQLFFPEENTKPDFLYITQNFVAGKLVNQKQIYKVIKQCFKNTLLMLEKCLQQDKYEIDQLQCVHLDEILSSKFQVKENTQFIVLAIPILFKSGLKKLHQIEEKIKQYQDVQLIVVNVFSDIKTITDINWTFKKLRIYVNAFLVGKLDKFFSIMNVSSQSEPESYYKQDKFFQKLKRFIEKRQTKKN